MKNIATLFVIIFSTFSSFAQDLRSSYFMKTSMFRHQMNPALLSKPYIAFPMLGNINIGSSGRNGLSTFIYPSHDHPKYNTTTFMSLTVDGREFLKEIKNNVSINAHLNYNVLSAAFEGFGGMNLAEINIRSNTYSSFPHSFFVFMKSQDTKEKYTFDKLGFRSETYAELVLGHSRKLSKKLSVGAKFKVLVGGSYAQFDVNHLNLTSNNEKWLVDADVKLSAAVFNSNFKHTKSNGENRVVGLTKPTFGLPGLGAALDIGIAYEASFIQGLTLSASVTDLGYMTWKETNIAASKGNWLFEGFKNIAPYEDAKVTDQVKIMKSEVAKMLSMRDQGKSDVGKMLVTTLHLAADYRLPSYDRLHFGALLSRRFNGIYSDIQATFSGNLRPLDWLEVSLNTSTTSDSVVFGGMLSFYTRRFNFYIGSDKFFGAISKEYIPMKTLNANLCMGITIPLEKYR